MSGSFERWLDGRLEGGERDAFQARLERDPRLAADAALQAAIDRALRRGFAPPVGLDESARALAARARLRATSTAVRAADPPAVRAVGLFGWSGLVAAALLVVALGLVAQRVAPPAATGGPRVAALVPADELLRGCVAPPPAEPGGLVSCSIPASTALDERDGRRLRVGLEQDVPLRGPVPCAFEPTARCWEAFPGGEPVVLIVEGAVPLEVPQACDASVFTRTLGPFRCFEISALARPLLLERLDQAPIEIEPSR